MKINLKEFQLINRHNSAYEIKNGNYFMFLYDISSCSGCIDLMNKSLVNLIKYSDKRIDVIMIYQDFKEVKNFCLDNYEDYLYRINFYFADYTKIKKYNITYFPTLFIFDKNGEIIFEHNFISGENINKFLKKLHKYY